MKTLFATLAAVLSLSSWGQVLLDQNFVSETSLPDGWADYQFNGSGNTRFSYGTNGATVGDSWKQNALDTALVIGNTLTYTIDVTTYATTSNQQAIIYLSSPSYSLLIGNSYDDYDNVYIGEIEEAATNRFNSFQPKAAGGEDKVPTNQVTVATAEEGFYVGAGLTYHLVLFGTSLTGTVSDGTTTNAISYTLSKSATFDRIGLLLDGAKETVGVKTVKIEDNGDELGLIPYHWYKFNGSTEPSGQASFEVGTPTEYTAGAQGVADTAAKGLSAWSNSGAFDLGSGSWTLAFVAKLSATTNGTLFCAGGSWVGHSGSGFAIKTTGAGVEVDFWKNTNSNAKQEVILTLGYAVADVATAFHQYAITYDAEKGVYTLVVDGLARDSVEQGDYTYINNSKCYQFGGLHGENVADFEKVTDNEIDDLRVYQRALTGHELDTIREEFISLDTVAKIGSTEYAYLAYAVEDVTEGGTITLVKNSDAPAAMVASGKTFTLDCSGYSGNKIIKLVGEEDAAVKPTVTISGGSDWGLTEGSCFRDLNLALDGVTMLWLEKRTTAETDITVDLEIKEGASAVLNGGKISIGNLIGAGSFVKKGTEKNGSLSVTLTKDCLFTGDIKYEVSVDGEGKTLTLPGTTAAITLGAGASVVVPASKDATTISAVTGYKVAASGDDPVTYTAKVLANCTVTLGAHENATVTGLPDEAVSEGDSIEFTVEARTGYDITAVKANGETLTGLDGKYTYTVTGDTEITVDAEMHVPQNIYATDAGLTTFVDASGNTVKLGDGDTITLDSTHYTVGTTTIDLSSVGEHKVLWSLSGAYTIATIPATASIEITDGTTLTLTTDSCGIKGSITIDAGATLKAVKNDQPDYNASTVELIVKGTLDMGSYRWTIANHTFTVYTGATISGAGDGQGAIDLFKTITVSVVKTGDSDTVNWSANTRLRANETFDVPEGATVNLTGNLLAESYNGVVQAKTLTKTGLGTLVLNGSNPGHTLVLNEGSIASTNTLTIDSVPDGYRLVTTSASGTNTYTAVRIYTEENGLEPYHWYKFDGDTTSYGLSNFTMTANAPTVYCAGATNGADNAFGFADGTNQRIYGDDSGFSLGSDDWTIAIVGKLPSNENGTLFCAGSASWGKQKAYAFVSLGSSNGIKVTRNDGAFTLAADVAEATTTFHAYALTYAKDAQTYTLYVDGVAKALIEGDYTFESDEYQFGNVHGATGDAYKASDGTVDDFRVYHQALTADQLKLAASTFGLAVRYELKSNESSHMTTTKIVTERLDSAIPVSSFIIPNGTAKSSAPVAGDPVGAYYIGSDDDGNYIQYVAKELPPHTFEIGTDGNFKLDGTNFLIRCAEMHFARIPRGYWKLRIQQAKACGFNAVCAYMFWNNHEPEPNVWRFDGEQDVHEFCKLAQEEGMWVVLRPGPYTCAEWEYGGFPWWFRKENVSVRSLDEKYMTYSARYLKKVNEVIGDMQITRGGNILMVQVENEYGFFGSNANYMRACYNATVNAGFEVPKFCCAPKNYLYSGYIPELFPVINGSGGFFTSGGGFDTLRSLRKGTQWENAPLMVGEYYPAWYDTWGAGHHTKSTADCVADLVGFCTNNASFSVYMAHGGTSFGWWAGYNGADQVLTTSYDYEAPITEAGHYNEKFWAFKEVLDAHLNAFETAVASNDVPKEVEVQSATIAADAQFANFWTMSDRQFTKVTNTTDILSFEQADLGYGYAIYETTIPANMGGTLKGKIKDLGVVRIDGEDVGFLDRRYSNYGVTIDAADHDRKLQIFVDAFGRSHFYLRYDVTSGFESDVSIIDGTTTNKLENWTMKTFNLIEYMGAMSNVTYTADTAKTARSASIYKYSVNLECGKDTFLDMRDWKRGMVCLNGHWLGRYWSIGPQQTLYVPGCWLDQSGTNELIVVDVVGAEPPSELRFVNTPVLAEVRSSTDYYAAPRLRPTVPSDYLTDPVLSGNLANVRTVQKVEFNNVQTGRYVAVTITSGYSGNYTACAEFNALDENTNVIDRTNWKVVAITSEEYVGETATAEKMLDGDTSTFWHSEWKVAQSKLPQSFVIDMGATNTLIGFTWQARATTDVIAKGFEAYVLMKGPFDSDDPIEPTPGKTAEETIQEMTTTNTVVITDSSKVVLTPEVNEETGATNNWTVTLGTGTPIALKSYYTPTISGSALVLVLNEKAVPEIAEGEDEEGNKVEPIAIGDSEVKVGCSSQIGLFYQLVSSMDLAELMKESSEAQSRGDKTAGTGHALKLTDGTTERTAARFYKVDVSDHK